MFRRRVLTRNRAITNWLYGKGLCPEGGRFLTSSRNRSSIGPRQSYWSGWKSMGEAYSDSLALPFEECDTENYMDVIQSPRLRFEEGADPASPSSAEVCAGAGGQALGLEAAGFRHGLLVEIDKHACATLRFNRPDWNVVETDIRAISGKRWENLDLLAGGVPCPPFSVAGKRLGSDDERDLFPEMIRLAEESSPRAVMIENVPGLLERRFEDYRANIAQAFEDLGFVTRWTRLQASDFGVSQLRPRTILLALRPEVVTVFEWPKPRAAAPTVGEALRDAMASRGWKGADEWAVQANAIAPTLVGGSKKHGGPDLGPTRARKAWAELGVNGMTIAEEPPEKGFEGMPRLTVSMAATIQGFPADWEFSGRKTNAYRQVGNAFPPPVAEAVGRSLRLALEASVKAGQVA